MANEHSESLADSAAEQPYSDGDARWAAVLARDPVADGKFYYSVATTGIVCRPSCPARRPRRAHVAFHRTLEDALTQGFRPCLRCRPEGHAPQASQVEAVTQACRLIEERERPPSLETLAQLCGLSKYHFHRLFKAATGLTPKAYAEARRAARLRQMLLGSGTVTEVAQRLGFSAGRFYARTDEMLGMSPVDFRQGGRGAAIRFAIGACSLGAVLVAATERGVCALCLGDDPQVLIEEFQRRFVEAELIGDDPDFAALVAQVVSQVEQPAADWALPLDVQGTAFQLRVWEALRGIPVGSTVSYGELARQLGDPKAVRAVARACATNEVAVVIPCHRVVRSDGGLAGYRWGLERKQALLDREAVAKGRRLL